MYRARNIGVIVVACGCFGKDIAAAEWALTGRLEQQLQYNDNFSFTPLRKNSVVGYLLNPQFQANRKTGSLDLAVEGQADIRRYSDSRWDCDNFNLGANGDYRTRRNVFSLNGEYGVNCSYALQLADTGLIVPNNQSEVSRLSPSWTWQWTDRDQLVLGASYSKISYSSQNALVPNNNNSLIFRGNDTYSLGLSGNHKWSRRLSLNGKLYFSNIQYTGANAATQNLFGFQLGGNYKIDRLWTIDVNAGPLWVDSRAEGSNAVSSDRSSSWSVGSIANVHLSYEDRLTKFSAGFANTVNPSAIGQTLQNQSLFASYSYRLNRHLTLDLSSNYTLSESVGDESADRSNSQFDRTYFSAAAGITWNLAKHWQIVGSYTYRRQEYQQQQALQNIDALSNLNTGTSESNVVTVFLNYSWEGIRISR